MERVLSDLPPRKEQPVARVQPTVSLEEMINRVRDRIERRMRTSFFELRALEPERKNIIVGFLAILELCKQGEVLVEQLKRYDDITLERERASAPRYY